MFNRSLWQKLSGEYFSIFNSERTTLVIFTINSIFKGSELHYCALTYLLTAVGFKDNIVGVATTWALSSLQTRFPFK